MTEIEIMQQNGQGVANPNEIASAGTILARDLMTELMGVVPVLGGSKVTVGFAGRDAFCNSTFSYVNIPALPPTKHIPMQIAREIRGFAAHEAAHIAFTDGDLFPSSLIEPDGKTWKPGCDQLLKETWNCVEDFMIEKHWLELYPGAAKNFAATESRACRGYLDSYGKNPDCAKDLRVVGPLALTWLRALYFALGTTLSRDCFMTLSPVLQARVSGWFADIEDVETTEDCLEAARRIHADIMAEPFDPNDPPSYAGQPNQPQQGQGSGQGQGQPGGAGGQQGGGASGGPGHNGVGDQGLGDGSAGPRTLGPNDPQPMSTSQDLGQVLNGAGAVADNAEMVTADILSDAASGPDAEVLSDPQGAQDAADVRARIQGAVAATSSHLRRALKAAAKDRFKGGRMDGSLDRRRLAQAAFGSQDIHVRKIKGDALDTALSIVIDCSGSMDETIGICQEMAMILEAALTGTPIQHEIVGYTTGDLDHADDAFKTMVAAHEASGKSIFPRAVTLYEFRKFGQPHHMAMKTIGNMARVPMRGTPTGHAMLMAHDRLSRRMERRHVMFVLTDGDSDDNSETAEVVKAIEKCGVTVVGIGIQTDSVKRTFRNHLVISRAEDLPALMMSQMTKLLLGDKHKQGLRGAAAQKARATA